MEGSISPCAVALSTHAAATPDEPMPDHCDVLLVEDHVGTIRTVDSALRSQGLRMMNARSGREAIRVLEQVKVDLLLVALSLPDTVGTDLVRALRARGVPVPFMLVCGSTPASVIVDAMRLGARGVLEKPVGMDDAVRAIRVHLPGQGPTQNAVAGFARPTGASRATATDPAPQASSSGGARLSLSKRSAAERWALLVLRTVEADADPKTLAAWAHAANVSRSALAECCRLVRVSPHEARDFARILRAIRQSDGRWQPEAMLDVADTRTMRKLLRGAGLAPSGRVPSIDGFLDRQGWIPPDNPGLRALRRLLGLPMLSDPAQDDSRPRHSDDRSVAKP